METVLGWQILLCVPQGNFRLVYKVTDWKIKLEDNKPSHKNLEILVEGAKGFISENVIRPKLMWSMNFTKEDQHDLWINDPAWGVIFLLKCKQPVNFLFIWWKPRDFFWNLTHKERDLKFSNLCTWGDLWGVIMRCEKSECETGIRIPPLLPSW